MAKQPISAGQRHWLQEQLDAWQAAGIVQREQVERILAGYETTAETSQRKSSLLRFTLMGIAAFFVGLAMLLLIGFNWDQLPRMVKLALVFGVVIGTHALGLYLRFRVGARRFSEIVFFLGCLFYGAGIWLVAQIFHLDSHYPDGVWWWALGVLPFALCLDTVLAHLLLVALLALWAGMEVIGFSHLGPWWWWNWWPNGAYSLPVLVALGLAWAYRRGSALTVGLYVPLFAWWIVLQGIAWRLDEHTVFLVGVMGPLLLILAANHTPGSALAAPYRVWGALLTGGSLAVLSFSDFQRETFSPRYAQYSEHFAIVIAIVVMVAATLVLSILLKPLGNQPMRHPLVRFQDLLRRQWFPFGLVALVAFNAFWSLAQLPALVPTILANVAMIALAFRLMQAGLHEERFGLFSAGVFYFLLWSVLRYIDLFGEVGGMLGASLMFFLCGASLFGLALFYRKRTEVRHV